MAEKSDDEEVLCEFFGIQITTKNPKVARILQTDMHEFMNQDIREIGGRTTTSADTEEDSDTLEADGAEGDLISAAEVSDELSD